MSRTRESRNIGSVMTREVRNGCTKVVPDRVWCPGSMQQTDRADELELCTGCMHSM